jgi:alginate O-acetyltransferase complex protein AlgJ
MSITQNPLPPGGPSREEFAKREIGVTQVAPALARTITLVFLLAISVVPLVEIVGTGVRGSDRPAAWSELAELPRASHSRWSEAAARSETPWRSVVLANREVLSRLSRFENALEDESLLGRTLRRPAQRVMAGVLGSGNERVYIGRDGWLFYRPDVEYITGQPFLDRAQLERRIEAAPEWEARPQPDPREAIVRFHRDLHSRGITLIVVPTPMKPGVHPEMLSGSEADGVLQNPSFRQFVDDVRRAGVLVFDPGVRLPSMRSAEPLYLATDTHWLPETMESAAETVAAFTASGVRLDPVQDPGYRIERLEVRNAGDTAAMLGLPNGDALFPPERVWLRRVVLPDGSLWRSSRTADVLLLGDSFSNIYSLESMGWGTSAGFAEHLSYALRRPLDRLVQNDDGAFATRAMLQQEPDRLDGKRVVIWQFAARELAFGDWKILRR